MGTVQTDSTDNDTVHTHSGMKDNNTEVKKYFTEHYNEFGQDPYKYGFIQFSQFVKVYEDKSLPDFNTYVKSLSGK
ncbi:MAG: hypothetical protein EOO38_24760 [Cytophagaceae bacterium]|nr:MAG: hypothetical protein EOO38_24760 [Cytophagaceae bacterium]